MAKVSFGFFFAKVKPYSSPAPQFPQHIAQAIPYFNPAPSSSQYISQVRVFEILSDL
jgi:hypothetical protein